MTYLVDNEICNISSHAYAKITGCKYCPECGLDLVTPEIKIMARIEGDRCIKCGKPLENAIDSVTKEVSPYIWKHTCDCFPKELRVCKG